MSTSAGEQVQLRAGGSRRPARPRRRCRPPAKTASRRPAPFGVVEQVPAPVDHRAQRLVAGQRRTAAAGEQPEPVVEAGRDLLERQGPQPGGGQLDRQRHPVEPAADLTTAARCRRRPRSRAARRPPGRRTAAPPGSSARPAAAPAAGRASGGTGHSASPGIPSGSRLVASTRSRGQRPSSRRPARATASTRCSQLSSTSSASPADSAVDEPARSASRGPPARRHQPPSRRPSAPSTACGTSAGSVDRGQLDQPDPAGQVGGRRRLVASRVLPAPPGPTSVTRRLSQLLADPSELLVAADEAGQLRPQVPPPCAARGRRPRRRLGAEHRQVDLPQLGPGRRPARRRAAAGRPRRRPAPRPAGRGVQRPHQQAAQPLPQRMGRGERLQLGTRSVGRGRAPARASARSSTRGQPQLVQPGGGRARRTGASATSASAGPRHSSERLAQQSRGAAGSPAAQRAPPFPASRSNRRASTASAAIEPVAAGTGARTDASGQRPAQPGHQRLQRVGRGRPGRVLRPQRVRERLDGARPAPRPARAGSAARAAARPPTSTASPPAVTFSGPRMSTCIPALCHLPPTRRSPHELRGPGTPAASLTFWTVPPTGGPRPSHRHEGTAALYAGAGSWQAPIRTRRSRRPGSSSAPCSTPRRAHVRAGRGGTS